MSSKRFILAILFVVLAAISLIVFLDFGQSDREVSLSQSESVADRTKPIRIERKPVAFPEGEVRTDLPDYVASVPVLPDLPTDSEISSSGVFSDRLWAIGNGGDPGRDRLTENRLVAELLRELQGTGDLRARYKRLAGWLEANPDSRWHASLTHELASHRFERGYFAEARGLWDGVWEQVREESSIEALHLGNAVLGRLLDANIGISRADRLRELIVEAEGRVVPGATEGKLLRANQLVWMLEHTGTQNVLCGPLALNAIKDYTGEPYEPPFLGKVAANFIATGIPLSEVERYSEESYGMEFDAFRAEAEVKNYPVPAVAHTKDDHYIAVLEVDQETEEVFIEDRSLGFTGWVDQQALDERISGVFLASADSVEAGFVRLSESEARNVFGRDGAHPLAETGTLVTERAPTAGGSGCGKGMPVYTFHPLPAAIRVTDIPLAYAPPVGPAVAFKINYNDLDSSAPDTPPDFSNAGLTWSNDWVAWIEHVGGNLTNSTELKVHPRGGGLEKTRYSTETGQFGPNDRSFAVVTLTGTSTYTREFSDGSVEIYDTPDDAVNPTRVFLTELRDPAGNALRFTYDATDRLVSVEDSIGQVTSLEYEHPADSYKITSVTDPFGRQALLDYDGLDRLVSVTDQIGLTSSFTYNAQGFLASITTPYGTTQVEKLAEISGVRNRILEITDPVGDKERIEYQDIFGGEQIDSILPPSEGALVNGERIPFAAFDGNLQYRNSYHWDKEAMHHAPGDYKAATNFRFLTGPNWQTQPVLEAVKPPLESRIWFNYPGALQETTRSYYTGTGTVPEKTLRMLSDGSVQMVQSYVNERGNLLKVVDPVGRTTEYTYADNGIDVTEVRQTSNGINDLLGSTTYNAQHRPVSVTDAAGQTSSFTYNARGQVLTVTNALSQVTTFQYDGNGFLLSIDGPLPGTSDTSSFTYDAVGRTRTVTGPDGYFVTFDYDDFDRLTRLTYLDGTYELFTYDRLDRTSHRDRLGRISSWSYNARRQLVSATDAENRTVSYEWCRCGDIRNLTDPKGRTTRWHRDIQGRVTAKEFPDGSKVRLEYDFASSRLLRQIDEKGQMAVFEYNLDDTLRRRSYPNATVATPAVSFEYDPNYPRATAMHDGIGTTLTSFRAAGSLGAFAVEAVDGPWDNDTITYTYDELGRVVSRAIGGVAETATHDELGRVTALTNPLGTFSYSYVGGTARLSEVTHGGGLKTEFSYLPNGQDRRMSQIRHLKADGVTPISVFDYTYDAAGRIQTWRQQEGTDAAGADTWAIGYDQVDQLTSVVVNQGGSPVKTYGWTYDEVGNRLTETVDGSTTEVSYNGLNQIDESSENLAAATYEWNSEGRLAAINKGSERSEFAYDGYGRRVRTIEKSGGSVLSTETYAWCGLRLCEQRDGTGSAVEERYFTQGFQDLSGGGASRFYTTDHLASVREVVDSAGAVRTRIDYDAWGNPAFSGPDGTSAQAFTGHFWHARSELYLAPYRGYSPSSGRWISREPLGEFASLNLYGYAANSPILAIDPDGEFWHVVGGGVIGGVIGGAVAYLNGGSTQEILAGVVKGAVSGAVVAAVGPAAAAHFGGGLGAAIGTGAVVGGGSNVIAQGFAMAIGAQNCFSWGEVGINVAAGGLFSGIGSAFTSKASPAYTYRGDSRSAGQIFSGGFQPRGSSNNLLLHAVDNTAPPSSFIATSKSFDVARNFSDNVFVVRPKGGIDVNKVLGSRSPYPNELEIAIKGGVRASDVRGVTIPSKGVSILNPFFKQ